MAIIGLLSGLLFGIGLVISGMINPAKVLAFLDVAGDWDPSLALVMTSAIPVAATGFALARRMKKPARATAFADPALKVVDACLVTGAVLFGIGWGLVGFCPGPALASLLVSGGRSGTFVLAMLAGMGVYAVLRRLTAAGVSRRRSDAALTTKAS